ncbi:M23 family metallopeptidase [Mesorhizobium sp. BAC0120]|uniref:M23 family metallopeptidase n=1 Tax=Mesorhizobium sp. BAC0120 TaxID=3090670 RepID=UPI00298D145B|nr:M23 family metallopeptidase [Mesorhizobium sp. BAC0120]MDW6023886.1 M23 family metallopeptidase [Mesorhizobium sp. BAC0120]
MRASGRSAVFGRRKEPHTVIIARGDQIRHFTVRPWLAALAGSAFFSIAIGYLLATSYLVLRDDLIGANLARQARMQQAYEDRISALRAQVDRITSRQLLDQQLMENKVSELLERQTQLSARHGRLGSVLDRAATELPEDAPAPVGKPDLRAAINAFAPVKTANAASQPFSAWATRNDLAMDDSSADHADRLFVAINQSLRSIEKEQLDRVTALAANAYDTADKIADALEAAGLPVDSEYGKQGIGGPLIAVDSATAFDTKVKELDEALDQLDALKKEARAYPIANPAPGEPITSGFGVRKDPLLGTLALHSGIDFRSAIGSPARATAPGIVSSAGWNGGYGRMVEVDHGNGFSTRYGHLSRIEVKVGDRVARGSVLGETGTSGRSTGPHLHYEVRRDGDAIDPLSFLKAGMTVGKLL